MFDKILVQRSSREYVPYEKTVIEKRAPTDDSIRLYKEMEDKVRKSVIDSIVIDDEGTGLKIAAVLYEDFTNETSVCDWRINFNNGIIYDRFRVPMDWKFGSKHDLLNKVYDELGKQIAAGLMKGMV
ncbi:MAG: hypothetical protein PVG39_22770, partial [Desulfobacteraceae bacterium]